MAKNSSAALVATFMLMMLLYPKFGFVIAEPSHVVGSSDETYIRTHFILRKWCAVKCAAKCLRIPYVPLKLACTAACLVICLHKAPATNELGNCTLDCANSAGNKFFSAAGNELSTPEDVEKFGGFVDVCYDKCNHKAA